MSAIESVPPRHLLPAPLYRPVMVVVALCTLTFVSLAIRVAGGSHAGAADLRVSKTVHALLPPAFKPIVDLISFGDAIPVIMIALILSVLALALGHRRAALIAVAGPLLTGIVTSGVKPLVGRTIREHLAYPSGHTGAWTSLGLVIALILIGALSAGAMTSALLLAGGALAGGGTMAIALIMYYSHYPSDTVGGFCAAVVCVLGCALLLERIGTTSSRPRPVAEQGILNDGD